ncbi:MAG: WD40 repeat domain-containing protein [Campylobacterota bacterium]|nr:WD40 repeat domain-containing protein [Campylobacterota bacterium]
MSKNIESKEEIDLNEKFYIFDSFLTSNKNIIERGDDQWDSSKIFFQLSIEHADNSPLTHEAERFEDDGKVDFDYVRDVNRDEEIYISPLVAILEGHQGSILGMKILEDGNLFTYSNDGTAKIWDKHNYRCLATLKGHKRFVDGLELLENKNFLTYSENTIKIWNNETYECISTLKHGEECILNINIDMLNYKNIVSFSEDNSVKIWDMNYKELAIIKGHDDRVSGIVILNNNNILSYSRDSNLMIWDKDTFECVKVLSGHSDWILSVNILNNNNILSTSKDGSLIIWDKDTYKCLVTIKEYSPLITRNSFSMQVKISSVRILKNNNIIYAHDEDVKIMDKNNYKRIITLKGHTDHILDIKILEKNKIISYSFDNTIRIWNIDNGKCIGILKGHKAYINGLIILYNNNILSYSDDKTIRIWDNNNYNCIAILQGHESIIYDIEVYKNNIISYSEDKSIRIWDILTYTCIGVMYGEESAVKNIKLQDNKIISDTGTNQLRIYDLNLLKYSNKLNSNKIFTNILLYNKNILSVSHNGTVAVWDKDTYKCIATIEGYENRFIRDYTDNIEILPNKNILTRQNDDTYKTWDKDNYKCVQTLNSYIKDEPSNMNNEMIFNKINSYNENITELKILNNNNIITFSRKESVLKVWDKDSHKNIFKIKGHKNNLRGVEILKNGNILSWAEDCRIIVFNNNFESIRTINYDINFNKEEYFGDFITGAKILKNNDILISFYQSISKLLNKNSYEYVLGICGEVEFTKNDNIANYCGNSIEIWDKYTYKKVTEITKFNIDKYYKSLPNFGKRLDDEKYIYANYFNEYHLNIIDKKTNHKLQWHSNYEPEVNALLGKAVTINDGDNGRILKVIKQKNKAS